MREKVFISHANPEDNDFSLWLTLRLAAEGFPVWCDLTKLLGGEDFWEEIEDAIRNKTAKFLYVLSKTSNHKEGPRKELRVASNVRRAANLKDFIIPLRVDETPFREFNIEVSTKTAIDFTGSWARGLRQLIQKLEEDQVSRKSSFTPLAVADWWSSHASPEQGVLPQSEDLLSNWFPLQVEPARLHVHTLSGPVSLLPQVLKAAPFPAVGLKRSLVTFAEPADIPVDVLDQHSIVSSETVSLQTFVSPELRNWFGGLRQRRNVLYSLFGDAWERLTVSKGLSAYAMANQKLAYCFTLDAVSLERIAFQDERGKVRRRALIGSRSARQRDGSGPVKYYWHFGLEAKPQFVPTLAYAIKYHLAFSDDGRIFWEDKDRAHRARRRVGKDWWNSEWRDRLLAAMSWFCQSADNASIPIGSQTLMTISRLPQTFNSPVSYLDPGMSIVEQEAEDEDEDTNEFAEGQVDGHLDEAEPADA